MDNVYERLHIPHCHVVRIYAVSILPVLISFSLSEQCQIPIRSLSLRQELLPKVYTQRVFLDSQCSLAEVTGNN